MVKSIYDEIHELRDIKFLIHHAASLFPADVNDVNGREIHRKLQALQAQIAQERTDAVDKLLNAVKSIYSETEPQQVVDLVNRVAALFKVRHRSYVSR